LANISLTKKLAFMLVALGLFFVVAESVVRTWVYFARSEYERFDGKSGTFVLVPGRHRSIGSPIVVNSAGFVGDELLAEGPDLWRIVAVGDSNTFGHGNQVDTYPAKLAHILRGRPSRQVRYEVVNAGIEGLDSEFTLRRLRSKVLPLRPQVILIYVGWNDLMKFDPLGQTVDSHVASASRVIDGLWLVKGLRKLIFLKLRPHIDPPAVGPESRTGRFREFVPDRFVRNLESMLDESRAANARVVVMTLSTSVYEDMTLDEVRGANVYFPYYRSGYGVGDLLDLVAAYNRAILRVADAKSVPVFRLDATLRGSRDAQDLFADTMHPTPRGQELVARTLADFLESHGLLGTEKSSHALEPGGFHAR
jgi:lysophospholipase L1-like esterase